MSRTQENGKILSNILIDLKGLITSDDIFNVEIGNWSKGDSYDLVMISNMKKLLKIRANDDYVPIIFLAEKNIGCLILCCYYFFIAFIIILF